MNRHKQQSEKAKELIEKLRNENGKSVDIDEVRIYGLVGKFPNEKSPIIKNSTFQFLCFKVEYLCFHSRGFFVIRIFCRVFLFIFYQWTF